MKLVELSIVNYRSIILAENVKISSFQALIGENNAGKSNILDAIDVFLSAGAGGVQDTDFYDKSKPIVIKCKFKITSNHLKKVWKPYAITDELILEKHIWFEEEAGTAKISIKNEFHGYKAEPKDWFLSIEKVKSAKGERPNWKQIVEENKLPAYFLNNDKCNQTDFAKGVSKYLTENEVEFDQPDLSSTQTLGFQSNVIVNLPKFYLLKAETKYSEETDKRSTSSTFRRLMGDLTDRIIKNDPKYIQIENALKTVNDLLNEQNAGAEQTQRLSSLKIIEDKIKTILCNLMPSVEKVKLKVITEDVKTIFSKGVELTVDDGVETDVLLKGHGLQRCIIFSLLQALILNERKQLVEGTGEGETPINPIILAMEEPELYIHPQLGKLFYDVLLSFSKKDQVIYTTHSPRFIDVYEYESIALVTKTKAAGTKLINCDLTAFNGLSDKKVFKGLTQLNTDVNELFFARNVIIVEGAEDKIAITETLKKLKKIDNRLEEIDVTAIAVGGKQSIPFFIRVLNAFKINFAVLHDLDVVSGMKKDEKDIHDKINKEIDTLAKGRVVTFPIKLEDMLKVEKGHFKDQYQALAYFSLHTNINIELESKINDTLKIVGINFE
jgi:predicted ATP-dependent endonuclease of OLD family